ncbi:MAG: glycosyltransferase family 4 protein [Verrucomicrobia bacterium]|nr:glycosyltransferase family 4 protein [Verrucomicrobiota bacterium]
MNRAAPLRILLLAPHPFYQERGTPIAVDLLLQALSRRGCEVDVATFPEGEGRIYPHVTLHRAAPWPRLRGLRPGFSPKKLYTDLFLSRLARRLAQGRKPDVLHAVEESVFLARRLGRQFTIPYVYDMDSSLARQLVEKMPWLKPLGPFFRWMEARAIRGALAVVPVCPALADLARARSARHVHLLTDVSLLPESSDISSPATTGPFRFMYIGNLERYQGIDLLLESFARARQTAPGMELVIVGGTPKHIAGYRVRAAELGLGGSVTFPGPRPTSELPALFRQAGALVSPRLRGDNTPMKIYSYLDSGRPLLATDLPTHTQVLTPDVALLAAPNPDAMAAAMIQLAREPDLGPRLAANARALVRERYSRAAFEASVNRLYDFIESKLPMTLY